MFLKEKEGKWLFECLLHTLPLYYNKYYSYFVCHPIISEKTKKHTTPSYILT